jgi:hypothetical protein
MRGMPTAPEFFDDYINRAPDEFRFDADPDYIDVTLSFALSGSLGLESAIKLLESLSARTYMVAHLTIPEVYDSFGQQSVTDIFRRNGAFWDKYFEVELDRLTRGSVDIKIHITLSSAGKKAAKEHPNRFLRALRCFIAGITIWSGVITISGAQGQPIPVTPPPVSVIDICEQFAGMSDLDLATKIEVDVKAESGATVCAIRLTEPPS